ncbi:Hypothetical predicted protein [Octopus vulgaris]|uniref:Uncharacterized protein n=1 Tax=Octopus vulgaris TaxID=6645 RepID=A0AA36AH74_OCTVU|nr:Hypothetical predicted protein [Octopus vulgaris]
MRRCFKVDEAESTHNIPIKSELHQLLYHLKWNESGIKIGKTQFSLKDSRNKKSPHSFHAMWLVVTLISRIVICVPFSIVDNE